MRFQGFLLAAGMLLCLTSCQKLVEYYNVEGKKVTTPCRITRIIEGDDPYYGSTTTYLYDEKKRPASISAWQYDSEQSWESFEYDDQDRLLNHYRTYYFNESNHYVYEGSSRLPVRDTLIDFADRKYVEYLTYDGNGRIVGVDKKFHSIPEWYSYELYGDPKFEEWSWRWFYDIRGNRQESPSASTYYPQRYSNVPSVYSLHLVWRITERNFSKHRYEIEKGITFNEHGLPLTFADSTIRMEYACD